jgi:hypothetical protein
MQVLNNIFQNKSIISNYVSEVENKFWAIFQKVFE